MNKRKLISLILSAALVLVLGGTFTWAYLTGKIGSKADVLTNQPFVSAEEAKNSGYLLVDLPAGVSKEEAASISGKTSKSLTTRDKEVQKKIQEQRDLREMESSSFRTCALKQMIITQQTTTPLKSFS